MNTFFKNLFFITLFLCINDFAFATPTCPTNLANAKRPLFVLGVPGYLDPSETYYDDLYQSTNKISQAVIQNGKYHLVELLGSDATVTNYENVLMCHNLKYFVHMGGEGTPEGTSFVLANNEQFDSSFFAQNPKLDLSGKGIMFMTCHAFTAVQNGLCPAIVNRENPPQFFASGISELALWGAPAAYGCFWKEVLINGKKPDAHLLHQCARKYDPTFDHNHAGIIIVGDHNREFGSNDVMITTNLRSISVPPGGFTVLKLQPNEAVSQFAEQIYDDQSGTTKQINCTPYSGNKLSLLNNPGLLQGEFVLNYNQQTSTCEFIDINGTQRSDGETSDVYGFYPNDTCQNPPGWNGDTTLQNKRKFF